MPDPEVALPPLLEGDFYHGASGPTLLIVLNSPESIGWLRSVFDGLAAAPVDAQINLVDQSRVHIGAAERTVAIAGRTQTVQAPY